MLSSVTLHSVSFGNLLFNSTLNHKFIFQVVLSFVFNLAECALYVTESS